jgi:archaellin
MSTIIAYDNATSPLIDSSEMVYDTVICSPAYVMRTPSHGFARENYYSKKEVIYNLAYTATATELKITELAAYIKGNIGIHFIEISPTAPLKIDISGEADGTYNVCMGVTYVKNQHSLINLDIITPTATCTNGTKLGTLVKSGGSVTFTKNEIQQETGGMNLLTYVGNANPLPIISTTSTTGASGGSTETSGGCAVSTY